MIRGVLGAGQARGFGVEGDGVEFRVGHGVADLALDECGRVEPGDAAERTDDRRVETTGSDGGVPEVDDPVPGAVQAGGGGPNTWNALIGS